MTASHPLIRAMAGVSFAPGTASKRFVRDIAAAKADYELTERLARQGDSMSEFRHDWSVSYPRQTWPVYTCDACGVVKCPNRVESQSDVAPSWWDEPCKGPRALSTDDIAWLTGTGRFAQ